MSKPTLTIYTDGASRGNPGPAAFAYIISQDGQPDIEAKKAFGRATNNVAEYTALIEALEHASKLGAGKVKVFSDSEFMVKQLRGENRVKHPDMQELYQEAKELEKQFEHVTYTHVRREQNSRADRLCNQALDGEKPPAPAGARKKAHAAPERRDAIRADALQCLSDAAAAWKRQDPRAPAPEHVWEQIWSILEEHGIVR